MQVVHNFNTPCFVRQLTTNLETLSMILARKYMLNVRRKPWGASGPSVDLTLFFLYILLLKLLKLLIKFNIEFISLLRFLSIQQYYRLNNRIYFLV